MDSNKNIILNLEQIKYELNVYNIGDGNGSIELNPDKEFYYYNDSVSIT
jgi:hypothetical protein